MSSAPGRRGTHWALVAMILGAIVMVYPCAFMIGSSLKTRKEFAEALQPHPTAPPAGRGAGAPARRG